MIAITGASGYLGRALLPVLVQHYGHRGGVVALARQATAHSPTRHFDLTPDSRLPHVPCGCHHTRTLCGGGPCPWQ